MTKKLISLVMALVLALGFTVPALAATGTASYLTTMSAMTALDKAGIIYEYVGIDDDGDEEISISYELNETEVTIDVFFDEDLSSVHLRVWDFIKYNPTNFLNVVQACNNVNRAYMWTAFYTEDDNTVTIKMDSIIDVIGGGDVVVECVNLMVAICDAAYGSFAAYNQ